MTMLTAETLLAGDADGVLLRPASVARLLGTPIEQRLALLRWLNDQQLIRDPLFSGPLADKPQALTIDAEQLAAAIRTALASGGLPFSAKNLPRGVLA